MYGYGVTLEDAVQAMVTWYRQPSQESSLHGSLGRAPNEKEKKRNQEVTPHVPKGSTPPDCTLCVCIFLTLFTKVPTQIGPMIVQSVIAQITTRYISELALLCCWLEGDLNKPSVSAREAMR